MAPLVPGATWIVGDDEAERYRDAGAQTVIEGGRLCRSRNLALDMAFDHGALCLQLSDDLVRIERVGGDDELHPASLVEFVDEARGQITPNRRLVGVAPTANVFYAKRRVSRRHFIVGDVFLAAPSTIRFDETLRLKEDYDYTAAHLMAFGEVARLDWWLFSFRHRTNAGGAVAYRTSE